MDKKYLITGGTGSLGYALARYILDNLSPQRVVIFSRDEFKQSEMAKEFPDDKIRFFIGDVRDKHRLCQAFNGIDHVIHAAALKQVPTLEYCPEEAIKTNVIGSMNVIDACMANNVESCVLISTDKAVNPVNLYGATKLCAEKLFMAANAYNSTIFNCVRYGNVIGSRGSVIPLFQQLKERGINRIPITDKEMTRFWITIDEAINLVMFALKANRINRVLVPRAPSMNMVDVATAIVPNCEIEIIGIRAGEKVHESLIAEGELAAVLVVYPEVAGGDSMYYSDWNGGAYTSNSENVKRLTKEEFLEKVAG